MSALSRREFLKYSSVLGAWALLPKPARALAAPASALPASQGRIATWRQAVRKEPKNKAEIVVNKVYDDLIPLYAQVEGEAPWPSNPIWYQTEGGYIHSGFVQPVENTPSGNPLTKIEKPGVWVQVCVPLIASRARVDSPIAGRKLYYGTVYRAVEAVPDAKGEWWYRLQEGIAWSPGPYVPASSVRYLDAGQLSALSVGAKDKRVEVNLKDQVLTCYEGDTAVFSTRTATGYGSNFTPKGEYRVLRKHYTAYMIGGEGADYYNLPGVSFPTYFTGSGIAVHGTYWHNDYGRPRSHGCVNVSNDAAQFVFRWTEPSVPYGDLSLRTKAGEGTKIVVI